MPDNDTTDRAQRAVDDYLASMRDAASDLPVPRRTALVDEIEEHIALSRADWARTESQVRELLDRLGSPQTIVAAERDEHPPVPPPSPDRRTEGPALVLLLAAELMALVPLLFPVSLLLWVVGVVCALFARRWTAGDKALALGVLAPGAWLLFAAFFVSVPSEVCFSESTPVRSDESGRAVGSDPAPISEVCTGGPPDWLPWATGAVLIALLVAQVLVAVRLWRRAL